MMILQVRSAEATPTANDNVNAAADTHLDDTVAADDDADNEDDPDDTDDDNDNDIITNLPVRCKHSTHS